MPCTSETLTRDGKTLDRLTNPESGLRIEINRVGAEPVSIARINERGEWEGFLYRDGDVTAATHGWNNHATVMGYYVHRLVNEHSTYLGQPISGGTHSFLRHKLFEAPEVSADALTYEMRPSQYETGEYPFSVSMKLTYRLINDRVWVEFAFQNHESCNTAHVGFGLHPGFAVQNLEEAEVVLPPGYYVRHLAPGNFLSGEQQSFDFSGGPMPFSKEKLPGSFLLELKGVPERLFIVEDSITAHRVELDYSEAPYLTIWSDGGPFICVEPCWGLPDHQQQRPFEDKLGIQEIPPDGRLNARFSIKLGWLRP